MGTAVPNNVTISQDSAQITISTTRVEMIWNKSLNLYAYPTATDKRDIVEGANEVKIIDLLLKPEKRWAIDGYLKDGISQTDTDVSGGSADYANEKRDVLRQIFYGGGTFTMNVEGTDYEVNSDKFNLSWVADDKPTVSIYSIKFTVVEGGDFGTN